MWHNFYILSKSSLYVDLKKMHSEL